MSKFVLLYDCPFDKCDKLWLYNGLNDFSEVQVIDIIPKTTYLSLTKKFEKIKLGRILLRFVAFFQSIKAIIHSNKNDIIVVWNYFGGVFLNQILNFFRINRKVVSFCWIELPKKKNYKKTKKCLENDNFIPIINDINLEKEFIELFNLKKWNGFMLPDVYDDNENFILPTYKKTKKYCFSGGLNNRDWETLMKTATNLPDIDFIIVTDKKDVISIDIPKNVKHYTNLPRNEYYNLMKDSYLTICPLKENRVSGLINILKSLQYGIPCITTNLDVTASYFSKDYSNLILFEKNNNEDLKEKILNLWNLEEDKYLKISKNMQNYIRTEFDPSNNVKKLIKELKKRKWL